MRAFLAGRARCVVWIGWIEVAPLQPGWPWAHLRLPGLAEAPFVDLAVAVVVDLVAHFRLLVGNQGWTGVVGAVGASRDAHRAGRLGVAKQRRGIIRISVAVIVEPVARLDLRCRRVLALSPDAACTQLLPWGFAALAQRQPAGLGGAVETLTPLVEAAIAVVVHAVAQVLLRHVRWLDWGLTQECSTNASLGARRASAGQPAGTASSRVERLVFVVLLAVAVVVNAVTLLLRTRVDGRVLIVAIACQDGESVTVPVVVVGGFVSSTIAVVIDPVARFLVGTDVPFVVALVAVLCPGMTVTVRIKKFLLGDTAQADPQRQHGCASDPACRVTFPHRFLRWHQNHHPPPSWTKANGSISAFRKKNAPPLADTVN